MSPFPNWSFSLARDLNIWMQTKVFRLLVIICFTWYHEILFLKRNWRFESHSSLFSLHVHTFSSYFSNFFDSPRITVRWCCKYIQSLSSDIGLKKKSGHKIVNAWPWDNSSWPQYFKLPCLFVRNTDIVESDWIWINCYCVQLFNGTPHMISSFLFFGVCLIQIVYLYISI